MLKQISITIEPKLGSSIYHVCAEVKELAEFIGNTLEFKFNGVKLICHPFTPVKELTDTYFKTLSRGDAE